MSDAQNNQQRPYRGSDKPKRCLNQWKITSYSNNSNGITSNLKLTPMKKLRLTAFLFTSLLLGSCVSYQPVTNYVDYSAYSQSGMFLTESNSVSFEYQPMGSVQVLLYDGYVPTLKAKTQERSKNKEDGIYYQSGYTSQTKRNATLKDALGMAVEVAKENGGNGIINLRYEYLPKWKMTPGRWQVTGMAIKK